MKYHLAHQAPGDTFASTFDALPIRKWVEHSRQVGEGEVERILSRGKAETLEDFATLLSPKVGQKLEVMAAQSQRLTQRFFGKAIRLFAPLYLSNECVNICTYCGFSRHNTIPRITIPESRAEEQVARLASQGFRALLLVAGEHPKYVSNGYVQACISRSLRYMPSISIELGPMETQVYKPLVQAGAEALIVYQETYHRPTYESLHRAGPKKYYAWRQDTPERGYAAGFRRLGIGPLFGLYDWRYEAIALAAHASYLLRKCWKAQVSISLPRMRPATGDFQQDPLAFMSDREMVQVICALRFWLPQVSITLSTREPAYLRDGLVPLGVTLMSAGSSTKPGGYDEVDVTQRPRAKVQPGEQFTIADERSPQTIASMIRSKGYEVVWKDHDQALAVSGG